MALVDPPIELYRNGALEISKMLVAAYGDELRARGLYEASIQKPSKPPIGGESQQATLDHFCHSFSTSAVRGQYALLDVNDLLEKIPSDLLATFTSDRVAMLDLAAGAGGGTLGLLAALAVLRRENLVPVVRTRIRILAADISPHALDLYRRMVGALHGSLQAVSIDVSLEAQVWDATKSNETAQLMDRWFGSNLDAHEYFALISALSGGGPALARQIERSVQHISDRLANYRSTFFILEPAMKGTPEFWAKVLRLLHLGWFAETSPSGLNGKYRWMHPFSGAQIDGSIWVTHYGRV